MNWSLGRANGVRWYEHVLKRSRDEMLRRALDFELVEKKGVRDLM